MSDCAPTSILELEETEIGTDAIPPELLKQADDLLHEQIHKLCWTVWTAKELRMNGTMPIIISSRTKGDKMWL